APSAASGFRGMSADRGKRRWVGVGEIRDGHRWDSPPKIRFAPASPLAEAVTSEPVSENSIPEAFWAVISRFWHRKWHKIVRLACGRGNPLKAAKLLTKMRLFMPVVDAGGGIYRL